MLDQNYLVGFTADAPASLCGGVVVAAGCHIPPADPAGAMAEILRLSELAGTYVVCHLRLGSGWLDTGVPGVFVRLASGDTFRIYPQMGQRVECDTANPIAISWFAMAGPSIDAMCRAGGTAPVNLRYAREKHSTMVEKLTELHGLCRASDGGDDVVINSLGLHLFARLSADIADNGVGTDTENALAVSRAKAIIARRLDNPPSIEELAGDVGMSTRILRRAFDETEGVTPKSYMVRERINEAATLLTTTELTVSQIAERLGFSTPFFFTRQFTQVMGMSPEAWRETNR